MYVCTVRVCISAARTKTKVIKPLGSTGVRDISNGDVFYGGRVDMMLGWAAGVYRLQQPTIHMPGLVLGTGALGIAGMFGEQEPNDDLSVFSAERFGIW